MNSESINEELQKHQIGLADWKWTALVQDLHDWASRFIREFSLGVDPPAVAVDRLPQRRLGQYRPGRNPLGLLHEITFNNRWLQRPLWQVLGTLLHELLHLWQEQHGRSGKGNYHNTEFRKKAATFGLIIDNRGVTSYVHGPFWELLEREGIDVDPAKDPVEVPEGLGVPAGEQIGVGPVYRPPDRKHRPLWVCQCKDQIKLRVDREDLNLQCHDCGQHFVRKLTKKEIQESQKH